MNQRPTKEQVEHLRRQYPAGTRITLHSMDDPQAPPPGACAARGGRKQLQPPEPPPRRPPERPAGNCRRAGLGAKSPPPGRGGGLGGLISGLPSSLEALLSRLLPDSLETEDLLLMLILYLMYRESGDWELLIIMGAMLFL